MVFGQVWGIAVSSGWVVIRWGRPGRLARRSVGRTLRGRCGGWRGCSQGSGARRGM